MSGLNEAGESMSGLNEAGDGWIVPSNYFCELWDLPYLLGEIFEERHPEVRDYLLRPTMAAINEHERIKLKVQDACRRNLKLQSLKSPVYEGNDRRFFPDHFEPSSSYSEFPQNLKRKEDITEDKK
jgi:hypothetical protein